MSSDPVARRNAGLRRISTITKGTVAGGLVVTGALSALAARSFSGTSAPSTASTASTQTQTQTTTATTTPSSDYSNSYSSSQLQSPSYSVRSSGGSGRVSSGGS
ncbi:MAG: hypothetical protein JO086_04040 [Acidimicrobiia bacterium]|nr:hypothetical protein [Acidimicrobiia bacterium]